MVAAGGVLSILERSGSGVRPRRSAPWRSRRTLTSRAPASPCGWRSCLPTSSGIDAGTAARPDAGRRIAVVGTSGSGKTTLAREIAKRTGARHVEIDALFWGEKWRKVPKERFVAALSEALAADAWVICGNYGSVRERVWARADTVVWLDYPLPLIVARLVRRTARRVARAEELWAGNRESLERAVSPADSILAWALRTHGKHRRLYPRLFRQARWAHLRVVRLRSPRQAKAWLATL